jgi:hypothetical protein
MPLPLADINQAMKEASGSNEKLLQIVREIELCIFRNVSAGSPAPPSPTPTHHHLETHMSTAAGTDLQTDASEFTEFTEGSSDGGDGGDIEENVDDPNWAWSISGDGVSPVYVPPSQDQST